MKRGVKAELCRPFMPVKEDMEGKEYAGFVYTGDYLISMSSLRGASKGSRHSATMTEPPKAKYSLIAMILAKRKHMGGGGQAWWALLKQVHISGSNKLNCVHPYYFNVVSDVTHFHMSITPAKH